MSGHPTDTVAAVVGAVMTDYLGAVVAHLESVASTEAAAIERAATLVADHVLADRLVYVYGPGGHSNLAAQEIFFRAGGLVNISAILDEGTLLSNGAMRSMAMERTPGYGRLVMEDNRLVAGDLLVLVNAYGINAALIDAALWAKEHRVTVIGVSSRVHADSTAPDHPARHPSKLNLHDIVDVHVDTKVPVGDAVLRPPGISERVGAVSTFANAYALNCLMASASAIVAARGGEPTIWRSGNAPGGDEQHSRFVHRYRGRVRWL